MTNPIQVTDEMRRAVYVADCRDKGHVIGEVKLLTLDNGRTVVAGPPGRLPHIECQRCGAVWLCQEEGQEQYGYEAAEVALAAKMKDPADAKSRRPVNPGPPVRGIPKGVHGPHD